MVLGDGEQLSLVHRLVLVRILVTYANLYYHLIDYAAKSLYKITCTASFLSSSSNSMFNPKFVWFLYRVKSAGKWKSWSNICIVSHHLFPALNSEGQVGFLFFGCSPVFLGTRGKGVGGVDELVSSSRLFEIMARCRMRAWDQFQLSSYTLASIVVGKSTTRRPLSWTPSPRPDATRPGAGLLFSNFTDSCNS